ncbi:MAG TPA: hypothetical protein VMV49_04425, partial [Candidatus Deferrimicrobium sp.]|nr:hypothetical protein [Candidatus Deferrimicrobium sp.]
MSVGLECSRCGSLRVVYYIKIGGPTAVLKAMCPNDGSKKAFRIPLASRDQWIGEVTDQIYRCAHCGQRLDTPVRVGREGRWIILYLECSVHGLKDGKRYILDTIYPVIENLHQNRMYGAPPTFAPPPGVQPPPQYTNTYNRVTSPRT